MYRQELEELGIMVKGNAGMTKTKCPKCSNERKKKSDPCLSVNLDKGLYNCHNCGWAGSVKFKAKADYTIPEKENANVSERVLKYFESRGISEPTLVHWKVGESLEYMPQVQKNRRVINFNYYRENKLVNVKYRDSEKNFKMVSGAELIFYGLDNIKKLDKVYVVEGEMDALSLHEAGVYSVCSVPNGASKGNQKLEYLDNCWQYFKDKKEIIICTDNDDAGLMLRNELARRFGAL
jgi:twinkle protein